MIIASNFKHGLFLLLFVYHNKYRKTFIYFIELFVDTPSFSLPNRSSWRPQIALTETFIFDIWAHLQVQYAFSRLCRFPNCIKTSISLFGKLSPKSSHIFLSGMSIYIIIRISQWQSRFISHKVISTMLWFLADNFEKLLNAASASANSLSSFAADPHVLV